ncbi:hypothetical protein B0T17DRAFT_376175 [Bombardia bombarda]|uniref:Uncharacterized protein n=1 Tax=Bombardia bombarda TaxID=252184 RepID=A0AA39WGP0_9PEZI|nr:hypothetical protein B0T17DRAFT_376175 [Bombardia bombarda]
MSAVGGAKWRHVIKAGIRRVLVIMASLLIFKCNQEVFGVIDKSSQSLGRVLANVAVAVAVAVAGAGQTHNSRSPHGGMTSEHCRASVWGMGYEAWGAALSLYSPGWGLWGWLRAHGSLSGS